MANNFFRFRQFTVYQDKCGMKVGTDGTLLGAWATGGKRILDIGTGTGLIALMMAQRFPEATVTAIDIDSDASAQARENVASSPFTDRIEVAHLSFQDLEKKAVFRNLQYDSIVCNPPFFNNSLGCPDNKRHQARHADSLPFPTLFHCVRRMLSADGVFSAVIPSDCMQAFDSAARMEGFSTKRKCLVKTVPRKAAKRILVEYTLAKADPLLEEHCLEAGDGERSEWYQNLTREFYLNS